MYLSNVKIQVNINNYGLIMGEIPYLKNNKIFFDVWKKKFLGLKDKLFCVSQFTLYLILESY